MGAFALPAVIGTMLAGTATQAYGQHVAGKATERAERINAALAKRDAEQSFNAFYTAQRRNEARNITRVAKSGVRLSGSPLAVLESNEYQASRQRQFALHSARIGSEFSRMRGEQARVQAGFGMASSILSGAGNIGALAIRNA